MPWDKWPGESPKAFQAFTHFLHQEGRRTIKATSEHFYGQPISKVYEWSQRWKWVERAGAFENDLARRIREKHQKRAEAMSTAHADIAEEFLGLCSISLDYHLKKALPHGLAGAVAADGVIPLKDLAQAIRVLTEVHRKALGVADPSTTTKVELGGPDGGEIPLPSVPAPAPLDPNAEVLRTLSPEELALLKKVSVKLYGNGHSNGTAKT